MTKRESPDILGSAMKTSMDDSRIESIEQLEQMVNSSQQLTITVMDAEERYIFIDQTVEFLKCAGHV